MKIKYFPALIGIIILMLALGACHAAPQAEAPEKTSAPVATSAPQQQSESPAQATQPAPTEPPASSGIAPSTMSSQGPGLLCAGSRGGGLSCLDENGWTIFTEDNSDLPSSYLVAGASCPDGRLAIAHISGVTLFDGQAWEQIAFGDTVTTPEGIACDAQGGVWVAHFQGVSYYASGQWTTYGSENLASGDSANQLVYDVMVAPDGKVWVLTSRSVALFDNGAWTVFQEGQGFDGAVFFNALGLDAAGRPLAAHGSGFEVYVDGKWQSIAKDDYSSPESVAVDAQGRTWLGTLSDGAYLFNGNTWQQFSRAGEALRSDKVYSLAADSSGRVWLGTSYGLTVYDGTSFQTLLMSNSDLADHNIAFLLVDKDGPSLPALTEKAPAGLTGLLEDANQTPLAGMRVEICVETLTSSFSGETPCSDQPFFMFTETDAQGIFTFEGVPSGFYVIVAETGTGWAQLTDQFGITSEKTLLPPGEVYDIGTLTLEP